MMTTHAILRYIASRKRGRVIFLMPDLARMGLVGNSMMAVTRTGLSAFARTLARDDRLYLRARVSVADLGGPKTLGPLSSLLEGKQELTVRGRVEVLGPGHAQFRIDEVSLKDLKLPAAIIPRLLARVGPKDRDSTTAEDAIPVRVARELADVRVARGRVTLYKNVP